MWIPKPRAQQGWVAQSSPQCRLKGWQKAWRGVRGEDFGEGKRSLNAPREKSPFSLNLRKWLKLVVTSPHKSNRNSMRIHMRSLYILLTMYTHSCLNKIFVRLKDVGARVLLELLYRFFVIVMHCTSLCIFGVSQMN